MKNSWYKILIEESKKSYFQILLRFYKKEKSEKRIYPSEEHIFRALNYSEIHEVKVVILGQDPYHTRNVADGLCFSVQEGNRLPPSLVNIFNEIEEDMNLKMKASGDLTYLAQQGVFLLNTILTVEEGRPLSHANQGWEKFTDRIIKELNEDTSPKVFLLWGNNAIQKSSLITNPHHFILKSVHPSPLSVYRGFKGNKHFSKTNRFLIDKGLTPIQWSNNFNE